MWIFCLALLLALLVLSLRGRRGHPGLAALRGWNYAHRGLHDDEKPENSMAAFRAALEGGYGIELDLHLLKDGGLGVMHDSDISRTTGQSGCMEEFTREDLTRYHLGGTEETIPEFGQVLELFAGKAPLIIELKTHGRNYEALTETAVRAMEGYTGAWCMESFDPWCVYYLRKHYPQVIRGQLSENYFRGTAPLPGVLKFILTYYLENFITRPDFIAHRYADRKSVSTWVARKLWGIQGVSWTLKTKEEYEAAVSEGWLPIFEGFCPDQDET